MLALVRTHDDMVSLPSILKESSSYSISPFIVNNGGFCVHPRLHIVLVEFPGVRTLFIPFVDHVFNLRCPSDVPSGNFSCGALVGLYIKFLATSCFVP